MIRLGETGKPLDRKEDEEVNIERGILKWNLFASAVKYTISCHPSTNTRGDQNQTEDDERLYCRPCDSVVYANVPLGGNSWKSLHGSFPWSVTLYWVFSGRLGLKVTIPMKVEQEERGMNPMQMIFNPLPWSPFVFFFFCFRFSLRGSFALPSQLPCPALRQLFADLSELIFNPHADSLERKRVNWGQRSEAWNTQWGNDKLDPLESTEDCPILPFTMCISLPYNQSFAVQQQK